MLRGTCDLADSASHARARSNELPADDSALRSASDVIQAASRASGPTLRHPSGSSPHSGLAARALSRRCATRRAKGSTITGTRAFESAKRSSASPPSDDGRPFPQWGEVGPSSGSSASSSSLAVYRDIRATVESPAEYLAESTGSLIAPPEPELESSDHASRPGATVSLELDWLGTDRIPQNCTTRRPSPS